MPKKILMVAGPVHPIPPLKGAAVETWMYEVSKRLLKYEPHIACISHPFYPLKEYRDGIYFHRIHFSKIYKRLFQKITKLDPFSYPKRIFKIIKEVKPDIVHMHNSIKWFVLLFNSLENFGVKTILHMHNETEVNQKLKVDAFAGCSQFIVESYRNKSIETEFFKVIHNGVDVEKFRPYWEVKELRENIRMRFGLSQNDFVVLFIGRVSPEKGVEHFINSAILLLKENKNLKFFIIGELSEGGERQIYAKKMLKIAEPFKNNITFIGCYPPSKIHFLYLVGDVVVVPSNFEEPFGMVAIEAMSTGLPVIVAKKGGLKEYIVDKVNGLFINENYTTEIFEKIKLLINNPDLRIKIGKNARETVENNFSWEKIVLEVEKFYDEVLKL